MHNTNEINTNELHAITAEVKKVIVGKDKVVDKVFAAVLAQGHVLMEDVPGVGKTTLAVAFSKALGLECKRIQFTPDTVASDITGYTAFDRQANGFTFHSGAAMTNILLADEINRTSGKTQSALLEVMEEKACTVDGRTYPLPKPFVVLATQNPVGSIGTTALPVSQLDRFMFRLSMGYPDRAAMKNIMADRSEADPLAAVKAVCDAEKLIKMQEKVKAVYVDDAIYDYITALCEETRSSELVSLGVSPRGALALCRGAKAWALYNGREYVVPQDVRELFCDACAHRLVLSPKAKLSGAKAEDILADILKATPCPENAVNAR